MKINAIEAASQIYKERYTGARALLLAGSVIRGESTQFSDLDIVVIFDHVEAAYRESFTFEDWPVEVFVHDPETLRYFFESIDGPTGIPSLPNMVFEGLEISSDLEFTEDLKRYAKEFLEAGPPTWTLDDLDRYRYAITDLCDDLRAPRSYQEMLGTIGVLQEQLTHFYFRSQKKWSGKGKTMARRWIEENPALAAEFFDALGSASKTEDPSRIIAFSEKILRPYGGWNFNGHRLSAPSQWRSPGSLLSL